MLTVLTLLSTSMASIPSNKKLTYTNDALPIFKNRCSQCHNESWADHNWMVYENAFRYRDQIKTRVWIFKNMPPGTFITEDERLIIRDWIDQGAVK